MKKIYIYQKADGTAPFLQSLNSLESKARAKLDRGLFCIATQPGYMAEPHIKHFSIEKYRLLWEYREHVRVPIRIVFLMEDDAIILLTLYIKKHEKNTRLALDHSMELATEIHQNRDRLLEYIPRSSR